MSTEAATAPVKKSPPWGLIILGSLLLVGCIAGYLYFQNAKFLNTPPVNAATPKPKPTQLAETV